MESNKLLIDSTAFILQFSMKLLLTCYEINKRRSKTICEKVNGITYTVNTMVKWNPWGDHRITCNHPSTLNAELIYGQQNMKRKLGTWNYKANSPSNLSNPVLSEEITFIVFSHSLVLAEQQTHNRKKIWKYLICGMI